MGGWRDSAARRCRPQMSKPPTAGWDKVGGLRSVREVRLKLPTKRHRGGQVGVSGGVGRGASGWEAGLPSHGLSQCDQ